MPAEVKCKLQIDEYIFVQSNQKTERNRRSKAKFASPVNAQARQSSLRNTTLYMYADRVDFFSKICQNDRIEKETKTQKTDSLL